MKTGIIGDFNLPALLMLCTAAIGATMLFLGPVVGDKTAAVFCVSAGAPSFAPRQVIVSVASYEYWKRQGRCGNEVSGLAKYERENRNEGMTFIFCRFILWPPAIPVAIRHAIRF